MRATRPGLPSANTTCGTIAFLTGAALKNFVVSSGNYTAISLTSITEKKRAVATAWTPRSVTMPTTRTGTI